MAQIVGYIASSLDGFIATKTDTLEWLTKYEMPKTDDFSYERFIAPIRTVVMGRGTWDYLEREGYTSMYADKRAIVVTSRPLPDPIGALETRTDIDALVAELRALDDGDVWMLGGGKLQMAFIERGALDEIEIYVMPELIGGGYPLFPPTGYVKSVSLISAIPLPGGCVRLFYKFS